MPRIVTDYIEFGEDELVVDFKVMETYSREELMLWTINGASAGSIDDITHNHCYDEIFKRYNEGDYDGQL